MSYSLQNYTTYSITSGVLQLFEWVDRAKRLNYTSLGVCDKFMMSGHIEFQDLCLAADINPIFGTEMRLVDDCSEREKAPDRGSILLYAKDEVGYQNMIALNNHAWTPLDDGGGFYHRPRIDIQKICEHAEGLIVVVPANDGAYQGESFKRYSEAVGALSGAFGEDLYLGVNPVDESTDELHDEFNLPLLDGGVGKPVSVFNCHYPESQQDHLYDIVRKIDNNRTYQKKNFDRAVVNGFLPYGDFEDKYLAEIEQKCTHRIPVGTFFMPEPELPNTGHLESEVAYHLVRGISQKLVPDFDTVRDWNKVFENPKTAVQEVCSELEQFVESVSKERSDKYPTKTDTMQRMPVYAERLRHESSIISKLGFYDYFLIVKDICSFVDDQGEERGPARGSAGGSLFSYVKNITKIDPLEFDLLFERFLNEDRADLPDIDLDFSSEGRAAVKDYILEKYGEDRVVSIGAYDRMKISSAVKMVAKAYAMGIPDNNGDIVHYDDRLLTAKLNQWVTATSRGEDELVERLEDETFRQFYELHSDWFDNVIMPLQETIVTTSRHAAGTLITAFPINECMPIMYQSGNINTQWRDRHCERRGFPKFDILAIKAVDMISYCKKLVKARHGIVLPPIEHVPLDDDKTMDIFRKGQTDGVFQAKSWLAKSFYLELNPEDFWDVTNGTSLNRPGPIDVGAPGIYQAIKNGEQLPEYEVPDMIPITEKTKGLVIYQEQMMEVVKVIGRLTPVEADYVRKACGKKKFDEMAKWKEVFVERATEAGYDVNVVHQLWDKVNAFAGYGFNLSHAVGYSVISYNHAWIKARFPVEFWCATLKYANTQTDKYDSLFSLKARAREEGIDFKYPSLYGFGEDFLPASEGSIYWPLHGIKGIGEATTTRLTDNGNRTSFESLDDMIITMGGDCNLGVYKKLITAGFFSDLSDEPWEAARIVMTRRNELLNKKDEIPYEMSSENMLDWVIAKNEAFGFIVQPWKDAGEFHPKVMRVPEASFAGVESGVKLFVGGYVEKVSIRAHKGRNRDQFYAVITVVDEGEKFKIMAWKDFWMNKDLDKEGNRPMKGDLIELIGEKTDWSPPDSDTKYHQLTLGRQSYMRKVWSTK